MYNGWWRWDLTSLLILHFIDASEWLINKWIFLSSACALYTPCFPLKSPCVSLNWSKLNYNSITKSDVKGQGLEIRKCTAGKQINYYHDNKAQQFNEKWGEKTKFSMTCERWSKTGNSNSISSGRALSSARFPLTMSVNVWTRLIANDLPNMSLVPRF